MTVFANHLWQSTFFVVAAWLLTVVLLGNRAAVRYWVWLAASIKFLIPFSWLVSVGSRFGWRTNSALAHPKISFVMEGIGQSFAPSAPVHALKATPADYLPAILIGAWFCGFAITIFFRMRSWRRVRTIVQAAKPLPLNLSIPAMSSLSRMEPGVFGIFSAVLLLPEGIADRLAPAQLNAIIAHELCHVRRRDNLAGALHMLVEAIFWFHPLVWWMETRLVEERERACDEEVLQSHGDPESYAEGILNVCRFCVESPMVCAAGVTGADLRKRIEGIIAHRVGRKLSLSRKLMLAAIGVSAVALPFAIGVINAPTIRAQAVAAFEVATVKPTPAEIRDIGWYSYPGGRLVIHNCTLGQIIHLAYGVESFQISDGPGWTEQDHWDITAKAPAGSEASKYVPKSFKSPPAPETLLMLRTLLAERFQLKIRMDKKEGPGYALVLSSKGAKFGETKDHEAFPVVASGVSDDQDQPNWMRGENASMALLATRLEQHFRRPVLDQTGLKGEFDFKVKYSDEDSLLAALQEQLGLKVVAAKVPLESIVIERVERPTAN